MDTSELPYAELVERLDHVSIAVRDLRASARVAELLGGRFRDGGLSFAGDFRWAQWDLPGGKLEMIAPVDPDDERSFLVRFLRDRGEGLHHLTLKVSDLEAAIDLAQAGGFEIVGVDLTNEGWKEAFVHPRSASGVLIQLAEFTDGPPPPTRTLDEVLGP